MNIIPVSGPIAGKILEAIQQRTFTEHGKKPSFEETPDAKKNFILIGGTHENTAATFDTFNDNHPGAGIVIFSDSPRILPRIPADRMIFVGTRNWDPGSFHAVRERNIKHYSMHAITQESIQDICDTVMENAKNYPELYVSVDLSVLDPAFAPGASQEPGGLTARELLYFLHRLRLLKNFSAADITGIPPGASSQIVQLAAKIAAELC